jgi:hypothetical protein
MFETTYLLKINPEALRMDTISKDNVDEKINIPLIRYPTVQEEYLACWKPLPKVFTRAINPKYSNTKPDNK